MASCLFKWCAWRRTFLKGASSKSAWYSGYTLVNRMGLSKQVLLTQEISSNFAPVLVRKMTIKNRQYIIRKPVVQITEENAPVLQLLDCLKDIEKCTELEPEKCYYK